MKTSSSHLIPGPNLNKSSTRFAEKRGKKLVAAAAPLVQRAYTPTGELISARAYLGQCR